MNIKLACGAEQIPIDVPDNWINGRCYRPALMQACSDARAELMAAISALAPEMSLAAITDGKKTLAIAVDSENPVVVQDLLPALIEMIEDETSIKSEHITIILSYDLWKGQSGQTALALVDEDIKKTHRVIVHDPFDANSCVKTGDSSKQIPMSVNKAYKEADVKIVLGGVRPDLFSGFTGGRAVLMPGLAGQETIRAMYTFEAIADRNTRYGNYRSNLFHMAGVESMNAAGCNLAVNAQITPSGQIQNVTAGHFGQSHMQAMNAVREAMTVKVKEPMDIVVTSGGGEDFDDTLMKLVPILSAVEEVLKPEGTIVISAALKNGIGTPEFVSLLKAHTNVADTLDQLAQKKSNRLTPAQWVAQRLYTILQKHEVILYNKTLDENTVWSIGLTPARDMNEAVLGAMESHGQRCKIVALPDGPLGIGEINSK
ncbi:hypothetical protein BH09SUM1_BH09SUM1_22040 [soil metagenome]